jgi:hypothetical protein
MMIMNSMTADNYVLATYLEDKSNWSWRLLELQDVGAKHDVHAKL